MKQLTAQMTVAIALLFIALSVALGAFAGEWRAKHVESAVIQYLEGAKAHLILLAETTDRNGAISPIREIAADCPRRQDFESLLVRLASLNKQELIVLQNLFEGCGRPESERKMLMVAELEQEFLRFKEMVELLSSISKREAREYEVATWEKLVTEEKVRADLLSDLGDIQEEIISELISGSRPDNARVRELVANGQNIGQRLIVADRTIDEFRDSILE